MFNKYSFKFFNLIIIISVLFSCKKDVQLHFSETNIIDQDDMVFEINIPKAKGKRLAAKQINATLIQFVNKALNADNNVTIEEGIVKFKKEYNAFKTQIGKTLFTDLPPWEVIIDGEVVYTSNSLVCVTMSSTINTGSAHSDLVFKFLNFDAISGKQLDTKALINNMPEFIALAKKYYEKELLSVSDEKLNAFKNSTFKLPETLGFSDNGVILFYDNFNTSVSDVIEFTIPYTVVNQYLNF